MARVIAIAIFGLLLWGGAFLWRYLSKLVEKPGKEVESSRGIRVQETMGEETIGEVIGKKVSGLFKKAVSPLRKLLRR